MRSDRAPAVLIIVVTFLGVIGVTPILAAERSRSGIQVMPGGVVAGNRIVYEGGRVVVVIGVGPDAFDSCPSGSMCLFDTTNWGGSMISFQNCCAWQNLADYGFNNIASSWRNRKNVDAQIADSAGGAGLRLCLNNNSYSSSMPIGWDNVASSLRVRDAGTYC